MASVDARSETVQPFEFAFRGDRPLDWSPDHERLLFASLRSASVQLYEWDRASGEVRPMTSGPDDHPTACYLPERPPRDRRSSEVRERKDEHREARLAHLRDPAPGGGQPRPLTPGPERHEARPAPRTDALIVYETRDAAGNPSLVGRRPTAARRRASSRAGRDADLHARTAPSWSTARSTRAGWRLYRDAPRRPGQAAARRRVRGTSTTRASRPTGATWSTCTTTRGASSCGCGRIDGRKDRPLIWNGDGITPVW